MKKRVSACVEGIWSRHRVCLLEPAAARSTVASNILVVEDQPVIARLVKGVLLGSGHTVVVRSSGAAALQFLREEGHTLSGIVTDIRLGSGPNGWDVARYARQINPTADIIYMTGDSSHEWEAEAVSASRILQKPFGAVQLASALAATDLGGIACQPPRQESLIPPRGRSGWWPHRILRGEFGALRA
ncbi:Response regulator receiver domain-containing protein [Sphingomonas sp. YR710]|uniref:response regulator n=1 Tax=Sphingomonas sp. YR710 TaxID=1882773 RepID=UPI00088558D2|nr:response regulator [Sphingomonas sp. YR710]SDC97327.1 Response regulator receiver domain-containing protein [Sphingomonas sp. YR710]